MTKFSPFTIYRSDGTKQLLYGTSIEDALSNALYSDEWVAQNIKDYRKGVDNSLTFVNGKWESNHKQNKIPVHEINQN